LESQRCDNTIGSYTCIRLQSCGTGYTLNAGTGYCDDDDECILNRHNCLYPYECRNTKGSFRCDKPRFTTTSTAKTTTTTAAAAVVTTPRVPFYVPTQAFTQSYGRFSLETTTPNPKIDEWNREFGPCNVGFHRNIQGACSGE
jgi:fibulin 1/2